MHPCTHALAHSPTHSLARVPRPVTAFGQVDLCSTVLGVHAVPLFRESRVSHAFCAATHRPLTVNRRPPAFPLRAARADAMGIVNVIWTVSLTFLLLPPTYARAHEC